MNERLVDFLYVLMRDEIPPGRIEGIFKRCWHPGETPPRNNKPSVFSNKGLEMYAREIAERLEGAVAEPLVTAEAERAYDRSNPSREGTVTDTQNQMCHVEWDDGAKGWIHMDYLGRIPSGES